MKTAVCKKTILLAGVLLLILATLTDIQYKGKMYQMMPGSWQDFLANR